MILRPYQRRIIDATYDYFRNNAIGNPLIVAPTAAGKSVIIGAMCKEILETWPNERILILSHVKELLAQNFEKITNFWPLAPAGIYCASLKSKRGFDAITVASIQSVHKIAHIIGWRSLILIDEAHLLGDADETMYRRFIADMKRINPKLKIIGLTATAWRTKSGMLHEGDGALFNDIAVEIPLKELLDGGYVSPLISKSSVIQADLSRVATLAGEFNAKHAEAALDKHELTEAALNEVMSLGHDRKSWLFFCTGIGHAEHVRDALRGRGISAECVTGSTPALERDSILSAFKEGRIRAITNANVLTTGFDAPGIDLIAFLRPTKSPGLYVQMAGRGMRLAPGKKNCLALDYAGNIERHGPITHVIPPKSRKKKKDTLEKHVRACLICPYCRTAAPLSAEECLECGHVFLRETIVKHDTEATSAEIMVLDEYGDGTNEAVPYWVPVTGTRVDRHFNPKKPPMLVVTYSSGVKTFKEYVCLEHARPIRDKAERWWSQRTALVAPPVTVREALVVKDLLKHPTRIAVRRVGSYYEVVNYDFGQAGIEGTGHRDSIETRQAGISY